MSDGMLVGPKALHAVLDEDDLVVFDCRFDLQHPEAGRNSWLAAHIPGAVYAHLDDDLAAPQSAGSGRHPLPEAEQFAAFLARSGWRRGMRCVAYDGGGGMLAARLWWLMRYFGAGDCALLDGGLAAWMADSLPLESGPSRVSAAPPVTLSPAPEQVCNADEVAAGLGRGEIVLLDARAPERFEGRVEPIDAVPGHVPGARNRSCSLNLDGDKRFLPPGLLRKAFRPFAEDAGPGGVVHMCGSGVTACHNLFAMELAGLAGGRLYPGSWSEWSRDGRRPVAGGTD